MVRGQARNKITPTRDLLSFPLFANGAVQAEVNLIRNPFCLVSKNHLKPKEPLVHRERSADGFAREWMVLPNVKYGFPGHFDNKVLMAVQKIATDAGPLSSRFLPLGTLRKMCELLQISKSGENTNRIKEALERIASTPIKTSNFYKKEEGTYWKTETKGGVFTLWNVYWQGEQLPNGEIAESVVLELHAPFQLSLAAYYTLPLDFNYYLSLPPIAARLYALTRLRFFGLKDSDYIRLEYPYLCSVVPLRKQDYFSLAKQAFEPAHNALKKSGWLVKAEWQGGKNSKPLVDIPWAILYYPGPRAREELQRARERQAQYQRVENASQQLLPPDQWARLDLWVNDMAQALDSEKNRPFYRLIAYLTITKEISENTVFRLLSETKEMGYDGSIKTSKSAWFTDQLKRRLEGQGKDLKNLLGKAKATLYQS